jgi:hypothetical protein
MEINPAFNKYMDRYFDFKGNWDCPSRCGLKIVKRKDGKTLSIATEIYRQNPGTPVTEWCAPLATQIMHDLKCSPENFIFIEHTPDLKSKITFYEETFDLLHFDEVENILMNPRWIRLTTEQVDQFMEG